MIISREEFSSRFSFRSFHTFEEKEELMSVERLFKENQDKK